MKKACILFLFLTNILFAQKQTLITNATIIDTKNEQILNGQSILIENDKIVRIGNITASSNAKVIDLKGKWVLPGLVDSHIHLFQSGGLYTRPDGLDLRKYRSYEAERQWLKDNAGDLLKRYLACGITTVMDIGGPLYNFNIRNQFNQESLSPNIIMTGPLISTYQPEAFKIEDAPIIKANTPKEARKIVQAQLPQKPDFIKIWFINATNNHEANLPILEATIDEAKKNDLQVAVHATDLRSAKLAIKAGAKYLVHNVYEAIDEEFIGLMQQYKVTLNPTMIVSLYSGRTYNNSQIISKYDFQKANPFVIGTLFDLKNLSDTALINPRMRMVNSNAYKARRAKVDSVQRTNLKRLFDAGINLVVGTDAGNLSVFHGTSFLDELLEMKKAGLSNNQLLKMATFNAANIFSKHQNFGTIAEGQLANLLVLNSNPLENLESLHDINTIFNKGQEIKPSEILIDTPEILAQKQLNGYNARNIEAFLEPYADDVEIYTFPNTLRTKGKDEMRKSYDSYFQKTPNLHCEIKNRIIQGNTVIDKEYITGAGKPFEATAIYQIENNKIRKVYFVK